jgi:hypothetical protein
MDEKEDQNSLSTALNKTLSYQMQKSKNLMAKKE